MAYPPDPPAAHERGGDWPDRLLASIAAEPRSLGEPSPEELRVLEALAAGCTVRQAADMLGRRYETVQNQLHDARFILGAKNSTHAVALALRRRLIR